MDSGLLIAVASLAVAVASVVWGILIYLEIRAHRDEMDDLEGRWK